MKHLRTKLLQHQTGGDETNGGGGDKVRVYNINCKFVCLDNIFKSQQHPVGITVTAKKEINMTCMVYMHYAMAVKVCMKICLIVSSTNLEEYT